MPLIQTEEQQAEQQNSYASAPARTSAILNTAQPGAKKFGVQRNETLDDLEKDDSFMEDAELFLGYVGDDDIFETLRDSDYNIYKGVKRAVESKDWPVEVKQAYARLRTRFDSADTGSFNQWVDATIDIGVDVVTDPITIATLLLSPFTGGASLAGRQAAATAARVGVKRFAKSRLASATTLGAADGAVWSGVDDWARQKTEESVGLRDSISGAQVLGTAAAGGLLGGFIGKLVDRRAINETVRSLDERAVQEQSRIMFGERGISKFIAKTIGKPASFLDPYTKVSKTAKSLQQLLRYDLGRGWGSDKIREVSGPDYFRNFHNIAGDYTTRVKQIVEPLTFNRNGVKMTSDVNDALITAVRTGNSEDATIHKAASGIRTILDEMKQRQIDLGLIQENDITNYFPRVWNRDAIIKNEDKFKQLLMEVGEAEDDLEAGRILEGILDKKNQVLASGAPVAGGSSLAPRKFQNITDDTVFDEFLDNDFVEVLHNYTLQTSKNIAKVETFGVRNLEEFRTKWLDPLVNEAKESGVELSRNQRSNIIDLYKYSTGEGVEYFEGKIGAIKDWTALGYQVSLLPLATLSSLTEIVLPLTRVSTPTYMKGLSQGLGAGFKKLTIDMLDTLKVKHNMSKPQVFRELNRFMLALDQGVADGVERLAGEGLRSSSARKWQNRFFKTNFLTQWTQIVQATSYITGKDLITTNLSDIAKAKNRNSRSIIRKINELADLGVDYKQGLKWVQGGRKTDDSFYEQIQQGAATFVNEVILPTSREAGTKSHIMSNPKTDILFQFMGYPAAFSNVVLKNMAKEMVDSPIRGTMKVAVGGMIMTEMARYGNWIRSQGESENGVSPAEARLEALYRWGGNGLMLDMFRRGQELAQATGNPAAAIGGFLGPLPGEVITSIAYRRGPAQILGSKVPGYGAGYAIFGEDGMDDYNSWLREQDKKILEIMSGQEGGKRLARATGGLVQVPQAPAEPDRRIDKLTGRPYAEQAGPVMSDPTDPMGRLLAPRQQFAVGGLVKALRKGLGEGVDALMDLPKDKTARTARAKEQGFDERVYYHGTSEDFEAFDLGLAGRDTGSAKAVFVSDNPGFSDVFAHSRFEERDFLGLEDTGAYPNIIPVLVRKGKVFDFESVSDEEIANLADYIREATDYSDQHIHYIISKILRGDWEEIESPVVQKFLKDNGYDSFYTNEGMSKNLGILNPKNVRSINATFDPEAKDDPRLMKNEGGPVKATAKSQTVNALRNSISRG